jgi:hypothetical protein
LPGDIDLLRKGGSLSKKKTNFIRAAQAGTNQIGLELTTWSKPLTIKNGRQTKHLT